MKTTNILIGVVIVILIIIAYFAFLKPAVQTPTVSNTTVQTQTVPATTAQFTGIDSEGNTVLGDGPIPQPIAQAQMFRISIKNFAFVDPSSSKPVVGYIPSEAEIIWTNNDSMPHTVTFDNGMANSGLIQPGKSFAFFFTKPGTYTYHCSIHPNMTASLSIK